VPEAPYLIALGAILIVLIVALRMRPRRYYFVRHGQTLLNKQHLKQAGEGGLSDAGKAQADEVGAALAQVEGLRLIISSPFTRAKETSMIIGAHLAHPHIRYTPLLAERKNPSEVVGKSTHDPEVERIVDTIDLSYHEDEYRFSDEENFLDLKVRGKKCLKYLAWHGRRETCVVTHHAFLKMLLCYMLYGERLHASDFIKLSFFNPAENGGITICTYYPWTRRWTIEGYNESAQN
jgi:broad specificity phosphatase PhoE